MLFLTTSAVMLTALIGIIILAGTTIEESESK